MHNVAHSPATRNANEETGQMPVLFGGDTRTETADSPVEQQQPQSPDFERIQGSGEFVALRSRLRRFVFPMSLLFLAWYLAYVLLAAYAHDFMSTKLFGHVNIAMVFGILQFASTIVITVAYVRFANHRIDPQVEDIRVRAGVTG